MRVPMGKNCPEVRPIRGRALGILCVLVLAVAACENPLEVPDPDVVKEGDVQDPQALGALVNGAIGDFQVAYTGSGAAEGIALASGLLADEYELSGTFPTRLQVDQRRILDDNATAEGYFRRLHQARRAAERAAEAVANFSEDPKDPRRALVLALAGFTYIFFGENYCSGVPFSKFPLGGGAPEFGPPTPTDQIFQIAISRFDEALSLVDPDSREGNLARVGKARALLNLDQAAEAANTVATVPTTFVFLLDHSSNTGRQNNGIWSFVNNVERWRVADQEGINGLPYRSDNDPRVLWFDAEGPGFDQVTPQFSQLKFPSRDSDMPVADGIEARLIEAEAALQAGDIPTFLTKLNDLRASIGMSPVSDPGTDAGRVDLLFKERAYWLWQTAHRLGDLRRLIRQYGRNSENVFPTGNYFKGGTYGPDVNFPIPLDEQNNPNFESCLNRDA